MTHIETENSTDKAIVSSVEKTTSELPGNKEDVPHDVKKEDFGSYIRSNWRRLSIVIGLIYANFWTAACVSLQAPFFPKEAEQKGATPTQYGFVFGVFELVIIIMSPVYGKLIPRISPKFLITSGVLLEGASCIAFGVLDEIPAGTPYITMAFVVRILEGFGASALMTASFTIIASESPNSVAITFSWIETAFGVGLIVGPTIGGALYQVGGFLLPFAVNGCFLLSGSLLLGLLLPSVDRVESHESRNLKAFLLDGGIITSTLSIVTSLLFIGFNAATLEPHLRKFGLQPVILGTIFIITGGIYAFTTPIWGRICDKGANPFIITVLGYFLVCIGLLFIGPIPIMPFEASLWLVILSLVIIGLGLSAKLVSSFVGSLQDTLARGFPDNLATYGMVSALFSSACSTGAFIGPSLGGFLLDTTGYEIGTTIILAEEVFFLICATIYMVYRQYKKRSESEEKAPLVRSQSWKDKRSYSGIYYAA